VSSSTGGGRSPPSCSKSTGILESEGGEAEIVRVSCALAELDPALW